MKNNISLVTLLRNDPELNRRILQISEEVKKDATKIKSVAEKYNERYDKEIKAGTAKKHLLIEDAKRHGKSIEEVERNSGFIPSVYTPILNWLYFFIMEGRSEDKELTRDQQNELYKFLLQEEKEISQMEKVPDMTTYIYGNITLEKFQTLKKLKRLSKSSNEHEAFQAYRKCIELCNQYKIEFDKIPN